LTRSAIDSAATSTRTPLGGSLHIATLALRHVKRSSTRMLWFGVLGKAHVLARLRSQARCGKGAHRKRRFSGDWETGA